MDKITFSVGGQLVGVTVHGTILLSQGIVKAIQDYERIMDESEVILWRAYVNSVGKLAKIVHQDVPNAPSYILFFEIEQVDGTLHETETIQDIPLYIRQWMEQESNSILEWITHTQVVI